jgi:hypothetical protein
MLAAALLCASTGLMLGLGKAPAERSTTAVAIVAVAAAASWAMARPGALADLAFMAAWVAILASAAGTLSGKRVSRTLAMPMAAVAGGVTGLLAIDWRTLTALAALPIALAIARVVVAQARGLAVKVVAGWLLAVAVLNASLAMLPVTPGYLPDHLE